MQKAQKSLMDSRNSRNRNLSRITDELQGVQQIMIQNIDDVLQRGETLSGIIRLMYVNDVDLYILKRNFHRMFFRLNIHPNLWNFAENVFLWGILLKSWSNWLTTRMDVHKYFVAMIFVYEKMD